jgi:hypothetical protein
MIDIADLIPQVIESMKLTGQIRPTVYTELDQGNPIYPLFHFEGDGRRKAHLLFVAGRQAGQQQRERELVETVFVAEAWLTQGPNPTPGSKPPAGIPHKEAAIFAIATNVAPFQARICIYEIKRKKGKVSELVVFQEETIDPKGLQGVAFLAGWRSRDLSDAQVTALQPRGMCAFLR